MPPLKNMVIDVFLVGGGGGGRPDMAQAGGKKPEGVQAALDKAVEVLTAQSK